MPVDDMAPSLQESILAALLFNDKAGAAIAAQVTSSLFDESYRDIADRALTYRRKYRRAPGRAHLDDLFGRLLQPGRAPKLRRLVFDLAELAEGINGDYVLNRTQDYIREQKLKGALIQANSRFEQGGDGLAEEVEGILGSALRYRASTLDAGTFLNDSTRSLKFFDNNERGLALGIPVLDKLGLRLSPGKQLLYIGPKSTGKSWSCVHVGARGISQGERVLHVSLEMPEEDVAARYYQKFFAAATRPDKFNKTVLEFDRLGRLSGWRTRKIAPKWDFSANNARRELLRRMKPWGTRFKRLVIKTFPSGSLTIQQLEGYLDYLELEHNFIPTLMIVDYPDLMALDSKNLRISTGRTFVELRGIAGKRNLMLFTPTQSGRSTINNSKYTRSSDVTEDVSKVFTADITLTYQQTEDEERLGLARLKVEHARGIRDGMMVVITQSYDTGQWVLQGAKMDQVYWDQMREVTGDSDDD